MAPVIAGAKPPQSLTYAIKLTSFLGSHFVARFGRQEEHRWRENHDCWPDSISSPMLLKAQQVFRRLTPYQVIADLRLPMVNRDGAIFTPHSKFPEYSFEIRGNELVGTE